jgi:uncharacterized protein (DUF1499 family)
MDVVYVSLQRKSVMFSRSDSRICKQNVGVNERNDSALIAPYERTQIRTLK